MKVFVHQDIHFISILCVYPSGYLFQQYDDRVVFFKLANSHILIPEVTGCELHVKSFIKDVLFPSAIVSSRSRFRLSRKSMIENFPVQLELCIESISPIVDELPKHTFTMKTVCSAKIVRYALLL